MSIKLALLKSGESVIADVKELISDDKVCGYLFTRPHIVDTRNPILLTEQTEVSGNIEVSLSPWILLTQEEKIPVAPEWIVTIVEPVNSIKQMYEEKVNDQDN
jgi:hypothetical protein